MRSNRPRRVWEESNPDRGNSKSNFSGAGEPGLFMDQREGHGACNKQTGEGHRGQ